FISSLLMYFLRSKPVLLLLLFATTSSNVPDPGLVSKGLFCPHNVSAKACSSNTGSHTVARNLGSLLRYGSVGDHAIGSNMLLPVSISNASTKSPETLIPICTSCLVSSFGAFKYGKLCALTSGL